MPRLSRTLNSTLAAQGYLQGQDAYRAVGCSKERFYALIRKGAVDGWRTGGRIYCHVDVLAHVFGEQHRNALMHALARARDATALDLAAALEAAGADGLTPQVLATHGPAAAVLAALGELLARSAVIYSDGRFRVPQVAKLGDPGVRDPTAPCARFEPGSARYGGCIGDGHYLCQECVYWAPGTSTPTDIE